MSGALVESLRKKFDDIEEFFSIVGLIDQNQNVYPLGTDTKVLSTIFELVSRPHIVSVAEELGLIVEEPDKQNYYPDFTIYDPLSPFEKVAIDVKTTYRPNRDSTFGYTLGGYTSFIRREKSSKNILYDYSEYRSHWILGFVYERNAAAQNAKPEVKKATDLLGIPLAIEGIEIFLQQKWKIASDKAGSGNTTNIGSIKGKIEEFENGQGPFESEEEYLEYWRGYARTKKERENAYSSIEEFREIRGLS